MAVVQNYMPGDSLLIDKIVYELKSQGIFDQFRKECIADVDTKPAYQNLRQRVEGSVSGFLNKQKWSSDMNKNHVREMLRKNIHESGFLETGVERIVDQVVNPKINSIFLPKVTEIVYKHLGIEKYSNEKKENLTLPLNSDNLLPTDLEAVSPESEKKFNVSSELQNLDDSKIDEDESPPFEPLEEKPIYIPTEDNSVDSHLSGFSGLVSHDSNHSREFSKPIQMEILTQDSVLSKQSSDSRLSIVMSDDNDTKMEICENSQPLKPQKITTFDFTPEISTNNVCNKSETKSEEKSKSSKNHDKHRSRHDSKSDRRDDKTKKSEKDRKEHKHSSSSKDKEKKDVKISRSDSKTEKDSKYESKSDKDKNKSSSGRSKHSSSSSKDKEKGSSSRKESTSSSKDRGDNKEKSKSSSSTKDKSSKHKNEKSKSDLKIGSSKHTSRSDKHKKDEKEKHKSEKHSSSSKSKDKDKKEPRKDKKDFKDDHFSSKKKPDRRSTDRDSNDGQSNLKSSTSSFESYTSSQAQGKGQESSNSNSNSNNGSGDSGNSDSVEKYRFNSISFNENLEEIEIGADTIPTLKLIKPKFASNIHEARRLMKIRKQLSLLEKEIMHNKIMESKSKIMREKIKNKINHSVVVTAPRKVSPKPIVGPLSPPLKSAVVSAATWDALEAKLHQSINYSERYDGLDMSEETVVPVTCNKDDCLYLEIGTDDRAQRYIKFATEYMNALQKLINRRPIPHKKSTNVRNHKNNVNSKGVKRKFSDYQSDVKNNNKRFNTHHIEVHENFILPLSPAESDNSVDKKSDTSESSDKSSKKTETDVMDKVKRNIRAPAKTQRYSSEDLYKPRPIFGGARRRNGRSVGLD